jgi:hypothetical protein
MRPFVLKQHDRESDRVRQLRAEELDQVAGGLHCPRGMAETITVGSGDAGSGWQSDGCDTVQ